MEQRAVVADPELGAARGALAKARYACRFVKVTLD